MSARTKAAFSALAGLDPLRGGPGSAPATSGPELDDADADVARIIATPRSEVITAVAAAQRVPQSRGAPGRRRIRYGAAGLVASAAIAMTATLLWASPSAGSPPDQVVSVPAQISPAHAFPPT